MHDEIAERVWEAVGHWVEGRREESAQLLDTLAETQAPSMMYGVACGIATVAKAALTYMHGSHSDACFWGIRTVDGLRPEDFVPPQHLFAARFIAACLNNDTDTALALYQAAYTSGDSDLWPACMHTLLAATGEAVIAATRGGQPVNRAATYSADGLRHDVADPATWSVRVCGDRCTTCIFRPGNLMNLEPGRVASMLKEAVADEGYIVCHKTLGTKSPAICAGFAKHPTGRMASLALRLALAGVLRIVPVQPYGETGS